MASDAPLAPAFAYRFPRYLAAKVTLDDRALNRPVWDAMVARLPAPPRGGGLRVLEVGAGIGTMVTRLAAWGALPQGSAVTAIDAVSENIAEARVLLTGRPASGAARSSGWRESAAIAGVRTMLEFEAVDVDQFVRREAGQRQWDLVVAHAVLDLLDLPAALPGIRALVAPGGLLYATLTFDGGTIFQPEIDAALDRQIEALYHAAMDARPARGDGAGESRAGRHLYAHLGNAGFDVLAMGSSDWVALPHADGYPGDEAYVLQVIIETIRRALVGHPDLDARAFARWVRTRRAQIDRGELLYIAHQLDVVAAG